MSTISIDAVVNQMKRNPVRKVSTWKEHDILDRSLFSIVMRAVEEGGHTSQHFFTTGARQREPSYNKLAGRDFRGPIAHGVPFTQWNWMKDICALLQVEWPTGAPACPPDLQGPPDYAYTTVRRFGRKRTLRDRRERKGDIKKQAELRAQATQLEEDPVAQGKQPLVGHESTAARPMSAIWQYLKVANFQPDDLTAPGLSRDQLVPFDLVFPRERSWVVCWDACVDKFEQEVLPDVVCVEAHALPEGYYKLLVSQRAGSKHSIGNAKAVLDCWSNLRRWIRILSSSGRVCSVVEFFSQGLPERKESV